MVPMVAATPTNPLATPTDLATLMKTEATLLVLTDPTLPTSSTHGLAPTRTTVAWVLALALPVALAPSAPELELELELERQATAPLPQTLDPTTPISATSSTLVWTATRTTALVARLWLAAATLALVLAPALELRLVLIAPTSRTSSTLVSIPTWTIAPPWELSVVSRRRLMDGNDILIVLNPL